MDNLIIWLLQRNTVLYVVVYPQCKFRALILLLVKHGLSVLINAFVSMKGFEASAVVCLCVCARVRVFVCEGILRTNLCRRVVCDKLCQTAGVAMVTRPGSENPLWRNARGPQQLII